MSIDILIEQCAADRRLFQIHPYVPHTKIVRELYVSPSVKSYLESSQIRAGQLHGQLDSFIGGNKIVISMLPRNAGNAFFGLLEPPSNGLWDLRSIDPRPALRILGAFAKKDCFIGLVLRTRSTLKTEKDWDVAITECKREWRVRFHALLPLTGGIPNDHFSNWVSMDI